MLFTHARALFVFVLYQRTGAPSAELIQGECAAARVGARKRTRRIFNLELCCSHNVDSNVCHAPRK